LLAKSKAEKRKQKCKQKQVQVKRTKAGQVAADKGWFYYKEAHYYHDTKNFSQALKFIKKAVKYLPIEEEVLRFMGQISELADDSQVKLDALDGLEKIGKMTDLMRYNRVILLVNMGKYERCLKTADALLQNFTQLKLDDKRRKKSDIKNITSACVTVFARLISGRTNTDFSLTYNPVTKDMDPVACQSCGTGTYSIGLSPNLHINCPDCLGLPATEH